MRSPGGRSEWGNAYPYDLLGAWDFARAGAGGDAQVGLVGLSKGGFTALNAMGHACVPDRGPHLSHFDGTAKRRAPRGKLYRRSS